MELGILPLAKTHSGVIWTIHELNPKPWSCYFVLIYPGAYYQGTQYQHFISSETIGYVIHLLIFLSKMSPLLCAASEPQTGN